MEYQGFLEGLPQRPMFSSEVEYFRALWRVLKERLPSFRMGEPNEITTPRVWLVGSAPTVEEDVRYIQRWLPGHGIVRLAPLFRV